ncbi:hypothetical protein HK098_001556 [Nowakowskiella sp. JEL0407]|nr:hypothetical protein HK098_001556 [Nowakowskiella sp. JEL0407]
MDSELSAAVEWFSKALQPSQPTRKTPSPTIAPSKPPANLSPPSSSHSGSPLLKATTPAFEPESPPTPEQLATFQTALYRKLEKRFTGHWFPSMPQKGSAFRSISFFGGKIDGVISAAGTEAKISLSYLSRSYSPDLVVWIDPGCVSYRISEYGYTHMIYEDTSVVPPPVSTSNSLTNNRYSSLLTPPLSQGYLPSTSSPGPLYQSTYLLHPNVHAQRISTQGMDGMGVYYNHQASFLLAVEKLLLHSLRVWSLQPECNDIQCRFRSYFPWTAFVDTVAEPIPQQYTFLSDIVESVTPSKTIAMNYQSLIRKWRFRVHQIDHCKGLYVGKSNI